MLTTTLGPTQLGPETETVIKHYINKICIDKVFQYLEFNVFTFTDIDDCTLVSCEHGGTCTDGVNSYACHCVDGYTGTGCETGVS